MSDEVKRSRLAEWGSQPMTGRGKLGCLLGAVVLVVCVVLVLVWIESLMGNGHQELEDRLNERYDETIELGIMRVRNSSITTFTIDGVQRPDCKLTQDDYLRCDDPKPTLTKK